MRKILLFAAALLTVTAVNAKVWRINYNDNAQADFKTIKACLSWNGFTEGDTLYIEQGNHSGSTADNTISKPCTVIGIGWGFKDNNNDLSASTSSLLLNSIYIGADNVTLQGVSCMSAITLNASCSNLLIEKCNIRGIRTTGGSASTHRALNNLVIKNNYIQNYIYFAEYWDIFTASIVGNIITSYVTFNKYHQRSESSLTNAYYDNITIDHNTFVDDNTPINNLNPMTVFSNNIVINTSTADYVNIDCILDPSISTYNNVLSFTTATIEEAEYSGDHTYDPLRDPACTNKIDATVANTFKCHIDEGIVDNAMYYQVKDDAVAKTADSNGGECGAFGGDFPYQLNGRPNGVPYLYDINVPTHTTNNQLSISFKVAGNNE